MRILVLSDTHLKQITPGLPTVILRELSNADMLIHAGDFTRDAFYQQLDSSIPLHAVRGNMDSGQIVLSLPDKLEIVVDGVKIGITHGSGSPENALLHARACFNTPDIIVFGHSHIPHNEIQDGVLMFNPGSPTKQCRAPYPSYGIIEIDNGVFKTRIIPVNS